MVRNYRIAMCVALFAGVMIAGGRARRGRHADHRPTSGARSRRCKTARALRWAGSTSTTSRCRASFTI